MISICATIHNFPKAVEAFIRSIYDNATGEDFEIILISDRNPPDEDERLTRLANSYPRLSLIPLTRDEQLERQWELVPFWRRAYGDDVGDYARDQLLRWGRGFVDLWLQYAYGLNLAASKAEGEFLLLTPADFVVMCDLHALSFTIHDHLKRIGNERFFGHFSLVAPFERTPTSLRDVIVGSEIFSHDFGAILVWLDSQHLERANYSVTEPIDRYWPFNHGIRVVDKKTFDEVGGLRDEFLSKPGPTDIFNRMARAIAYGPEHARVRKSIEELTGFRARMASVPFDDDPPIEYLYPNPCDGDAVRTMQYAEEKWMMTQHPELKGLWT